ncbi:MAG TPA: toast rack family protein [Candidatus Acidoferrales bacterium]|nr:toast rack family protein [Candidatus Acidoferrales bacterium]
MPDGRNYRRGSISGAIFLIALGVFFLVWQMRPDVDLWEILFHYWPLILIFIGIGKILDALIDRRDPAHPGDSWFSGVAVALLALILLFSLAVWKGRSVKYAEIHTTSTVDLQGAKAVNATIDMPSGTLELEGGSSRLLDADFDFNRGTGTPHVDYSVTDGHGMLDVDEQDRNHFHIRTAHDVWQLHFNDDVPLDFKINLGAGQNDLRFNGMNVTRLDLNMGVGQLDADFTGPRKSDMEVTIQGGVGSAHIRLPRNIGVQVQASGGIGSIDASGLHHDGDTYVNDAFGKSKNSIRMTIHGGIGEIRLDEEP